MSDVHFCCWEKVVYVFLSQKWAGLSSAYWMLFSGFLKMGMRLLEFLCVPSIGWCPQKSNHTEYVSSMESTDSCKLPGRWRAEREWCPCNCLSCFGLESIWNWWRCCTRNYNRWHFNIATDIWLQNAKDNGITLGTLGLLFFPPVQWVFYKWEVSESF